MVKQEHPETRHWRQIAERYQRQLQAMLFELGRVQVLVGDSVTVSLNPELAVTPSQDDQAEPVPCGYCGHLIEPYTSLGSVRRYCGHRCQQRAYRARRKLEVRP
jgi:hypothetical protein